MYIQKATSLFMPAIAKKEKAAKDIKVLTLGLRLNF